MAKPNTVKECAVSIQYDCKYLLAWLKAGGEVSVEKSQKIEKDRQKALANAEDQSLAIVVDLMARGLKSVSESLVVDTAGFSKETLQTGSNITHKLLTESTHFLHKFKDALDTTEAKTASKHLKTAVRGFADVCSSIFSGITSTLKKKM